MEQYQTTGEDTIWSIILQHYGIQQYLNPEKAKSIYDQVARANPHIVHLETLTVGDILYLPVLEDDSNTPTQQLKAASKKKAATSEETD